VQKKFALYGSIVSDSHPFYGYASGQRVQHWRLDSSCPVAKRSRTVSSDNPALRQVVRESHAVLDGGNLSISSGSPGPNLELARGFDRSLLTATLLWFVIIIFSIFGPVPINNRVKTWDLSNLPPDWREQRQHWDLLNGIRVAMIAAAFLALVASYKNL
jgi:hypothetical protein